MTKKATENIFVPGYRLSLARRWLRLRRVELARLLDMDWKSLRSYEQEGGFFWPETFYPLCERMGIAPDWLKGVVKPKAQELCLRARLAWLVCAPDAAERADAYLAADPPGSERERFELHCRLLIEPRTKPPVD